MNNLLPDEYLCSVAIVPFEAQSDYARWLKRRVPKVQTTDLFTARLIWLLHWSIHLKYKIQILVKL